MSERACRICGNAEGNQTHFDFEAGLTALHWIVVGHGYDITAADVVSSKNSTDVGHADSR